jgi:RHS repeat-associated protein
MNVSYTYDAAGRMQTVSTPGMGTSTYQYTTGSSGNGWRNQYRVTYANGHSWEMRRDAFGELTKVEHAKTANQVTISLYTEEKYSYDGLGNIAGLTKRMKSTSGAVLSTKTYGYAYDGVNRITQETLPGGVKPSYTYDERGNRLSFQPQTTPNPTVRNLYSYNALNQVSSAIQLSGGNTASQAVYTYYGDGLRATKTVNGKRTRYVYLNGNVIDELDSSGNVKARNVWGNELLFRRDVTAGKSGYYFYNGHGDVTKVQDSANESVDLATYEYDIWGNVTAGTTSSNFSNPFRYTGEIQDDESGLIYLRARYYDPSEGRFLTEDTVEGQVDNPLTLNLYAYVHNNPLKYREIGRAHV